MNYNRLCSEHSGDFYGADYSLRHFRVVCVVANSPSRERSVRLIEHKSRVRRHFSEVLRVELNIAGVQRAGVVRHGEHGKVYSVIAGSCKDVDSVFFSESAENNVGLC